MGTIDPLPPPIKGRKGGTTHHPIWYYPLLWVASVVDGSGWYYPTQPGWYHPSVDGLGGSWYHPGWVGVVPPTFSHPDGGQM
jgi:hypothetical protein